MRRLAETLHSYDCRLSIQLTAGFGRVIPLPVIVEGVKPVSASENTNYYMPDNPDFNTRAITTEEAEAHARAFGYAAKRCREAGADCVELHGHEGYLMDQFMTGLWNRRDDRYGGSQEKRLTFAREAIEAIQREAGADFPIIYRFGIKHYLEGGREEEEGLWIAGELENMGVSALHVDAGCYETGWWPHPGKSKRSARFRLLPWGGYTTRKQLKEYWLRARPILSPSAEGCSPSRNG
jgi:2,4-dienoyl-CoA reductase-like NADH-dependent reductase (Old Yellow Enzyme family)